MRRNSFRNSIWRAGDSAEFRFVEDEDALPLATLLEEAQITFAVRVGEEIRRCSARNARNGFRIDPIQVSRDREKTLRPEEPAVGDLWQPTGAQRLGELATHRLDRVGVIDRPISLAATGLVESDQPGDPFQQGRFAGAVLADNDGDGAVEAELELVLQKRKAKRIGVGIRDARGVDPDALEIGRGHVDRPLASPAHAASALFPAGCDVQDFIFDF